MVIYCMLASDCMLTSLLLATTLFIRAHGGHVKTKGTIYLSNIRMVFVANKPDGNFVGFDMPLVWFPEHCMLCLILYEVIAASNNLLCCLLNSVIIKTATWFEAHV